MTAVWSIVGFFTVCWSAVLYVGWRVTRRKHGEALQAPMDRHPAGRAVYERGLCLDCDTTFFFKHGEWEAARALHNEYCAHQEAA